MLRSPQDSPEGKEAGIVKRHFRFSGDAFSGFEWPICDIIGARPGPRLCVSAGVHVNEVSSIEAAIVLQRMFRPEEMRGSVSIIPLINQPARFHYNEYVCPVDNQNINFSFPGNPNGSFSHSLCDAITSQWTADADCYVDMHGGDLREEVTKFSIYQRTEEAEFDDQALSLAMCFDAEIVVGLPPGHMDAPGRPPTGFARQRRFAIMSEAGSHGIVDKEAVEFHVQGVLNVARLLGIIESQPSVFKRPRIQCSDYVWVEAPVDGEFNAWVEPGERIQRDQRLGEFRDLFGEVVGHLLSPVDGYLLWRMTHPTLKKGASALAIAVEEAASIGEDRRS